MQSSRTKEVITSLDHELHNLAQPVSSLQCRLEIGRMLGTEPALREAVEGGLEDLLRLMVIFKRMREALAEAAKGGL